MKTKTRNTSANNNLQGRSAKQKEMSDRRRMVAMLMMRHHARSVGKSVASWGYIYSLGITRELIDRGLALLHGFAANGADATNFHFYVGDATTTYEVIQFLKREAPGLPIMTNECGIWNDHPEQVTAMLTTMLDNDVAPIVWYDITLPGNRAQELFYEDGAVLKPIGHAFRGVVMGCATPSTSEDVEAESDSTGA